MPQVIIQFDKTSYNYDDSKVFYTELYNSLGLDADKCFEEQEILITPRKQVRLFGMDTSIPQGIQTQNYWACRLAKKEGALLFSVGDLIWAADLLYLDQRQKVIKSLPVGLSMLSMANLPIQILPSLSRLENITHLNLLGCNSLTDISPLSGLTNLTSLDLHGCSPLSDISPLSGLTNLTSLRLAGSKSLSDISPLSGLTNLTSLRLAGSESLSDISPLSGLTNLTSLDLGWCCSLSDMSPLSGLTNLTSLRLAGSKSLSDISSLSGLTNLTSLDLRRCSSLSDISPLSGLTNLTSLDLHGCSSLGDISPLSGLTNLTSLDLNDCGSLGDISPLSGLTNLTSLDLIGCDSLSDISPLQSLKSLQYLVFTSRRIQSVESLRGIPSLRKVWDFNPPEVTELLANSACQRLDRNFINKNSRGWLQEARGWGDGPRSLQDRLAATLGEAFSLLGESPIARDYEEFLDRRPDFTAGPWKAWFGGTRKESGFELYRQRVERVPIANMLPAAIGGVCATLPIEARGDWSRQFLAVLEKERLADAKALLPAAPEICLAYARASEREALARWLEHFTDPSDPGALDPVHAALGKLRLSSGDCNGAEAHVFAIRSPGSRDPLLLELVSALASSNQDRASMALLLIEEPSLRSRAAKILAIHPPLSETTTHRLVVSTGDSPQALADLIAVLPAASDSELLRKISQGLQPERKAMMRAVAAELHDYADRLLAEADNAN